MNKYLWRVCRGRQLLLLTAYRQARFKPPRHLNVFKPHLLKCPAALRCLALASRGAVFSVFGLEYA